MKQPALNNSSKSGILPQLESELYNLQKLAIGNNLLFDDEKRRKMVGYIELLLEWNRSFNLIARGDEERIVTRHIVESVGLLIIADPPHSCLVMDVGSGGGFPAVPIKILRPDLRMTLVESNGKKASFLKNVGMGLSLHDYSVLDSRIENLTPSAILKQFLVMARAVAGLAVLWKWTSKHLLSGGKLMAIKGNDAEEIETASKAGEISEISTTPFPAWLNIEKSRVVISIVKK